MRKTRVFLLLSFLILCTGCAGTGTKETIIKAIDAAVPPFKELAFVALQGAVWELTQWFWGSLALLALTVGGLSAGVWALRGQDIEVFLDLEEGPVRWLVMGILIASTFAVLPHAFDVVRDYVSPAGLTFHFWRTARGLTIPIIEALPEGETSLPALWASISSFFTVALMNRVWEIVLVFVWAGCCLWAVFSGSLRPLAVGAVAVIGWACFMPFWFFGLSLGGIEQDGSPVFNPLMGNTLVYLGFTFGGMLVFYLLVPLLVALLTQIVRRPERAPRNGHTARETLQTLSALEVFFNKYFGQGQASAGVTNQGSANQGRGGGEGGVIYGYPLNPRGYLPPSGRDNRTLGPGGGNNPQAPRFGGYLPAPGETGRGRNEGSPQPVDGNQTGGDLSDAAKTSGALGGAAIVASANPLLAPFGATVGEAVGGQVGGVADARLGQLSSLASLETPVKGNPSDRVTFRAKQDVDDERGTLFLHEGTMIRVKPEAVRPDGVSYHGQLLALEQLERSEI